MILSVRNNLEGSKDFLQSSSPLDIALYSFSPKLKILDRLPGAHSQLEVPGI